MPDTYRAIWGWDGSWEFYGYAPPQAVDQVRRALDGLNIQRSGAPRPLRFWGYDTPYPVGGVRWPAPPWFEVSASTGRPPDVVHLSWGRYYTEPNAYMVTEGLQRLNITGLWAGGPDYTPKTGAFA